MNFHIEIIKNALAKIKYYDYTQIEIPYFNEIINIEFLGFNHLDYNFKLAVIVILFFIILKILLSIATSILYKIKTCFNKLYIKYKSSNNNHFNLLISNRQTKTVRNNSNLFAVVCHFEIEDETIDEPSIFKDFTETLLINQTAKIKYENDNIIFLFENFYKKINSIITQLYITKEILTKKYPRLKIYMCISNLEKDLEDIQLQELIEILNKKIDYNYLITNSLTKFYYEFISPKQYIFNPQEHSLFQDDESKLYAIVSQVVHT